MKKTYNIGDLVRIKEEELIGSKYGTIHGSWWVDVDHSGKQ